MQRVHPCLVDVYRAIGARARRHHVAHGIGVAVGEHVDGRRIRIGGIHVLYVGALSGDYVLKRHEVVGVGLYVGGGQRIAPEERIRQVARREHQVLLLGPVVRGIAGPLDVHAGLFGYRLIDRQLAQVLGVGMQHGRHLDGDGFSGIGRAGRANAYAAERQQQRQYAAKQLS